MVVSIYTVGLIPLLEEFLVSLAGSSLLSLLPAPPVEPVLQIQLASHLQPLRDALRSHPAFPRRRKPILTCRFLLAGLSGAQRSVPFLTEEKAAFYHCLYALKRTATERAALPRPTERRLIFRPRNAAQTRRV